MGLLLALPFTRPENSINIPALAAGSIGGALFGPRSAWARTDCDRLRVVFGLAFTALAIGAILIGFELAIGSVPEGLSGLSLLGFLFRTTLAFSLLGVVVFGVFALPMTLLGAVIWMVAIIVVRSCWGYVQGVRRAAFR